MSRTAWQRTLVDSELLDSRLLEGAAEAGERVAIIEVVEVALVLARRAGDVKARFRPGPRERDVAPLLKTSLAGSQHEGSLNGEALRGVASECVRVPNVARC